MTLTSLPQYRLLGRLDLTARKTSLQLTVASLFLLFGFVWLFGSAARLFRGYDVLGTIQHYGGSYDIHLLFALLGLFGVLAVLICVHEALHGLFIWIFTGKQPRYGFKVHP